MPDTRCYLVKRGRHATPCALKEKGSVATAQLFDILGKRNKMGGKGFTPDAGCYLVKRGRHATLPNSMTLAGKGLNLPTFFPTLLTCWQQRGFWMGWRRRSGER